MHNRLRMIVASYLTKNLLVDWRLGEKYFMETLIDGEHTANNGYVMLRRIGKRQKLTTQRMAVGGKYRNRPSTLLPRLQLYQPV